jgi:short-subunit dehydrogenase
MRSASSATTDAACGRALITGGSGGIGAEFARQLARQGYTLILVARTRSPLEQLAQELRASYGVEVEVLVADLSREDSLRTVEERIASDPTLTLLVNCAGTAPWGRFAQLDLHRQDETIRLNVLAPVRLTWAAVTGMIERGRGAIINVSSLSAYIALPFCAVYGGTKAYLASFTEALHEELRGTGVKVQALCPGFTRTGLFAREGADINKIPSPALVSAQTVVRGSLAALRRDRAICVPGFRFRLLALLLRLAPRSHVRRHVAALFGRFDALRLQDAPSSRQSGENAERSDPQRPVE